MTGICEDMLQRNSILFKKFLFEAWCKYAISEIHCIQKNSNFCFHHSLEMDGAYCDNSFLDSPIPQMM